MISLSSEITDTKGKRAARAWVFFDRDCRICTSLARRFRRTLEARGFGLAALQDPRVQVLLNAPPADLLREMRVVTAEGKVLGGAKAVVYLARQIWWAWPFFAAAQLPGAPRLLDIGYRWFANHRRCMSRACAISGKDGQNNDRAHVHGERLRMSLRYDRKRLPRHE